MEPWFVLWNLLLLRLLYISIKVLYGDAWNTVVMFRLVLLAAIWNWIQKWICRPAGPSLAACFEPLAHPRNFASLVFFHKYYFWRCSSELAQLVSFPYLWGRSTLYSDRLHDVSVTIPRCYKDVYVNSLFPCTARLWNSLPIECFPLAYGLNGFKSSINRHLLLQVLSK